MQQHRYAICQLLVSPLDSEWKHAKSIYILEYINHAINNRDNWAPPPPPLQNKQKKRERKRQPRCSSSMIWLALQAMAIQFHFRHQGEAAQCALRVARQRAVEGVVFHNNVIR